jgi:hypothetical protein
MPNLIVINTITHHLQRLKGSLGGDWRFHEIPGLKILEVTVSDMGDWKCNFLLAFHELVEAIMCKDAGITTEMVDTDELKAQPTDDPDSFSGYPGSCYQQQHNDALALEWMLSRLLGVKWTEYAERFEALKKNATL